MVKCMFAHTHSHKSNQNKQQAYEDVVLQMSKSMKDEIKSRTLLQIRTECNTSTPWYLTLEVTYQTNTLHPATVK